MIMNIVKLSRPDLFSVPSTHLYLTKEKFRIFHKPFQINLTMKTLMNNENKNISRIKKDFNGNIY